MSKYKLSEIAEIQSGPFGTQLHKEEYVTEGIPMLNSKNVGNGTIFVDSLDYVPETVCERLPRYILKEGDILFGRAGTIERHAYVTSKYDGAFQGTNCIRIRCKEKNKALYISYYLWKKELKHKIENMAGGSIQSYITTDLLKDIEVDVLDGYMEISNLLDLIDSKIENNNEINSVLQKQIKTIFGYWFLQYKAPRCSTSLIYSSDIKQNIPKDWSVVFIDEVVNTNTRGITPCYENGEDVIPVINQKCIRDGTIIFDEVYWHKASSKYDKNVELKYMDVLVNSMGTGTLGRVSPYVSTIKAVPHSCVTLLRANPDRVLPCWFYSAIKYLEPVITDMGNGSTGQTSLSNNDLGALKIVIPPMDIMKEYEDLVSSSFEKMAEILMENDILAQTREWLLPMLMNGQAVINE